MEVLVEVLVEVPGGGAGGGSWWRCWWSRGGVVVELYVGQTSGAGRAAPSRKKNYRIEK